jgi:hypothetical protein
MLTQLGAIYAHRKRLVDLARVYIPWITKTSRSFLIGIFTCAKSIGFMLLLIMFYLFLVLYLQSVVRKVPCFQIMSVRVLEFQAFVLLLRFFSSEEFSISRYNMAHQYY